MGKFCCCCLYKDAEPDVFSSDIYRDISAEAQRKEYEEAKLLNKKLTALVKNDPHNEFVALRNYYKQRIQLKVKTIRYQLLCQLSLAKVEKGSLRDTQSAFFAVQKASKKGGEENEVNSVFVERMRGLYSYNVLDSPDFLQAKKIERRIAIFDKKRKKRAIKEAERLRKEALEAINIEQQSIKEAGSESPTKNSLSRAAIRLASAPKEEVDDAVM